jgi:lipoic acid synthetase
VDKEKSLPLSLDIYEPERIKEAVVRLDLDFVVLTSVARDDLEDGGSSQFRNAIDAIRRIPRTIKIEVLIPDFRGCLNALKAVVLAKPDIIGHNLETVPRIYSEVRPQADYNRALNILKNIKESDKEIITKSALLLGLGEEEGEVIQTIKDLVLVKTDILTLGQYLAPSPEHYRVKEFIRIEKFNHYKEMALSLGIKAVLSGPLVRSSYKAEELYEEVSGCMI